MKRSFDWQAWIDRNAIQVFDHMPEGWNVIIIWTCELKKDPEIAINRILTVLEENKRYY